MNPSIFTRQSALNCIPHIDRFESNGYTREEEKIVHETRKIFGAPDLLITATTVRVPVLVGNADSINAEFYGAYESGTSHRNPLRPVALARVVCIDGIADDENARKVRRDLLERRYPVPSELENDEWKDVLGVGRIHEWNFATTLSVIMDDLYVLLRYAMINIHL